MRLRVLAFGAVTVAAFAAAPPASGKDRAVATVTTKIPRGAEPGERLRVAWTLVVVDGQHRPFNASGVFVRLVSASGARSTEGFASDGAHASGEYAATVAVPEGGIGDVEIGLQGWSTDATGTRPSDLLFPLTNDPIASAPVDSRKANASSSRSDSSLSTVAAALGVALVLALALAAAAVVRRRQPRAAPTPQQ